MLELISNIAEKLRADGFSNGDRLAVCSDSRIEYYLLTLACWKIGTVIVPVSTRYPNQKLALALENIDCGNLFISRSLNKKVPNIRLYILEDYVCCQQSDTAQLTFEQFQFDLDSDADVLFTTGSSGQPKGVLHTIGNHYYNATGALQHIPFERGDRWLVSLPMYHISGFSLIMRSLIAGGTLVFPEAGESIPDAVINKDLTHLSLVPTQLNKLMQLPQAVKALRQYKSILLGGSASSPVLVNKALNLGLPLSTTYGLSELASQVATISPYELEKKPAASGRVLPDRDLKIADDGEILLKGPTLFKGYVFKDSLELPLDSHGYFHTGDVGIMDEDGLLIVAGRKDRMFISGGENIYPEEIEKVLLTLDSVEQVYIVPVPDAAMGHRPVAFIKTTSQEPLLNAEAVRVHLQTRLERFKIPMAFLLWPQLREEILKPDRDLFEQIAVKKTAEKENHSDANAS